MTVALTFWTELRWVGHAVTGIIGMILVVIIILTGALMKRRIRTTRHHHAFRYHKMASTWFGLFVIGTFILGLLTTLEHGEPLLESPHGIIGLTLVLLAIIQLGPCLLITNRSGIQTLHKVVGYSIVPLFILQTVIGFFETGIQVW